MLKKRIIPVLLLKGSRMVKGKNFNNFIDTGMPKTAVRIYNSQDADELVFLNIDAQKETSENIYDILKLASKECSVPLSAGGGVKSFDDVKMLLDSGADRVVINSLIYFNQNLVKEISNFYGLSTIVASVDYKYIDNKPVVFVSSGQYNTEINLHDYIQKINYIGVGELILTCIDNEGLMKGYDIDKGLEIYNQVECPIILNGGAGNFNDLYNGLKHDEINSVACSSLFHFGDNNPIRARSTLRNMKIQMRNLK